MSLAKRFAHFLRCHEEGAVAVEAALTAPVVILLSAFVLEYGMMTIAQTTLDQTSAWAANLIRTGSVSNGSDFADMLRIQACRPIFAAGQNFRIIDCNRLQLGITSAQRPEDVAVAEPVAESEFNAAMPSVTDTGGPGDYVVIRLYYPWHFFTPPLRMMAERLHWQSMLTAGTAFRNENY
jgi:Flp pilus assembly protein TadG